MDGNLLPFACIISGKEIPNKPWVTRLIELAIAGSLGGAFSLGVFFTKLDSRIDTATAAIKIVQSNLDVHDRKNTDYREQHARQDAEERLRQEAKRVEEDKKWEARITRMENCFIYHNCERRR